jgi:hypothetical protein
MMENTIFTSNNGARQPNVSGIAIVMMDNALPNAATALIASVNLRNVTGVRIIAVGMTSAITPPDLLTIASSGNDIITVVSYLYLTPKVPQLGNSLCVAGSIQSKVIPEIDHFHFHASKLHI